MTLDQIKEELTYKGILCEESTDWLISEIERLRGLEQKEKLIHTLECISKIEDDMDNFLRARAILAEVGRGVMGRSRDMDIWDEAYAEGYRAGVEAMLDAALKKVKEYDPCDYAVDIEQAADKLIQELERK